MSCSTFTRVLSLLVAPILLAACTPEFAEPPMATEFRCAPNCPVNSPNINSLEIGDVKLVGGTNSQVKLIGIRDTNGIMHPVTINDNEDLEAGDTIPLSGEDLLFWTLVFEQNGALFEATISAWDEVPSPIAGNLPMSRYALNYFNFAIQDRANVCPLWLTSEFEPVVTLIRGEIYDRAGKAVADTGAEWLTIACANEAAYKTKLLGYGPKSYNPNNSVPFSVTQRNATLKMVTADYCGTGQSFTQPDIAISWADAAHTIEHVTHDGPFPFEAYWTDHGALCLDTPRIAGMADDVANACGVPPCQGFNIKPYAEEIVWSTRVPLPPEETTTGGESGESGTGGDGE